MSKTFTILKDDVYVNYIKPTLIINHLLNKLNFDFFFNDKTLMDQGVISEILYIFHSSLYIYNTSFSFFFWKILLFFQNLYYDHRTFSKCFKTIHVVETLRICFSVWSSKFLFKAIVTHVPIFIKNYKESIFQQ